MYTLETEEYSFSLLRKSEENICGTTFVRLEHPRLLIVENAHKNTLLRKSDIAAANIDIFAYINSKFVYVEKHLKGQIKQMYQNIMKSKCDLERRVIENALSIAAMAPAEAGHKIMKEEGYLAISAGESLHLLRCRKVDLTLRKVNGCYDQLPVKMGNESLFLAPRSRILTTTGKEVICEGRLPVMYKLGQQWFRAMPDLIEGPAPQILKPHTALTWQYVSPESLAVAGIYSERDTKKLRDMIVFPIERPSILNKIAMGFAGRQIDGNDINIGPFLNEEMLNKIASSTWSRLLSGFMSFGTISAGFIGFLMLCRLIKLVVDTAIHGYAIYSIYGFSIRLLGSIWNSVTQLLLHLGHQQQQRQNQHQSQDQGQNQAAIEDAQEPLVASAPPISDSVRDTNPIGMSKLFLRCARKPPIAKADASHVTVFIIYIHCKYNVFIIYIHCKYKFRKRCGNLSLTSSKSTTLERVGHDALGHTSHYRRRQDRSSGRELSHQPPRSWPARDEPLIHSPLCQSLASLDWKRRSLRRWSATQSLVPLTVSRTTLWSVLALAHFPGQPSHAARPIESASQGQRGDHRGNLRLTNLREVSAERSRVATATKKKALSARQTNRPFSGPR
ncbi:unnamed protein product [Trichogramma brassicae]|uniref:Uncharacterized protein n=1 Tax=Trichogramma brassicae TaxID=86971 RepID=A0A6H5IJF7_9HYME|nr:unnamed protein product [Trichogramma brassicae]